MSKFLKITHWSSTKLFSIVKNNFAKNRREITWYYRSGSLKNDHRPPSNTSNCAESSSNEPHYFRFLSQAKFSKLLRGTAGGYLAWPPKRQKLLATSSRQILSREFDDFLVGDKYTWVAAGKRGKLRRNPFIDKKTKSGKNEKNIKRLGQGSNLYCASFYPSLRTNEESWWTICGIKGADFFGFLRMNSIRQAW